METKHCLVCEKLIVKRHNWSRACWGNKKFCSFPCRYSSQVGKKLSSTTRERMSISHMGNTSRRGEVYTPEQRKELSKVVPRGEKDWKWKGGITEVNHAIRNSLEFKLWRNAVFTRDNYQCVWCGARNGRGKAITLHADHIKSFAEYPKLRFQVSNGRTLCRECHYKRHSKQSICLPSPQSSPQPEPWVKPTPMVLLIR